MRFTYQTGAQPLEGYTIQRGIHRGGFGEVYFANSKGGKDVALKLLHREDREIEIRGVTQCLNLKHPNLVNLFDVKTDSLGDHWVVMEYVAGSNLEDVLTSFPNGLPLNEVCDWLNGLVAGVSHLHERGIVHRDLKPANVYRENGIVKIGDVGLSKRLDTDRRRQNTQSVGTVYYMAPEVANGQYGPEVDVYSLAVMLYEMLTGRLPFNGETTAEILMKHLTAQPDLSRIPSSLRPILARALEKDPAQRTPSVIQLEHEFRGAIHHSKIDEQNPALNSNSDKFPRDEIPTRNSTPILRNTLRPVLVVVGLLIVLFSIRLWNYNDASGRFVACVCWVAFIIIALKLKRSRRSTEQMMPQCSSPAFRAPRNKTPSGTSEFRERKVPQDFSWSDILFALSKEIACSAVIASIISAGLYILLNGSGPSSLMPGVEHAVFFISVSIVGAWCQCFGRALILKTGFFRHYHSWTAIAVGVVLGSLAFSFEKFLLVEMPRAAFLNPSASSYQRGAGLNFGAIFLQDVNGSPTWLGYICFFAIWQGIQFWNLDIILHREAKRSLKSTIMAGVMAFVTTLLFPFPQKYAVLWALTISATVQLASTWTPNSSLTRRG